MCIRVVEQLNQCWCSMADGRCAYSIDDDAAELPSNIPHNRIACARVLVRAWVGSVIHRPVFVGWHCFFCHPFGTVPLLSVKGCGDCMWRSIETSSWKKAQMLNEILYYSTMYYVRSAQWGGYWLVCWTGLGWMIEYVQDIRNKITSTFTHRMIGSERRPNVLWCWSLIV